MAWLAQFKQVWRGEREASAGASYSFVVVCLALATAARWGISQVRTDVPFSLYLPAVLLTTVFGGLRGGVAAAISGAVLGFIVDFEDAPTGVARIVLLAIYAVVASLTTWAALHHRSLALFYRDLSAKLQEEEDYRNLVVGELSHRLRNTLASVHAIVHQVLRDEPQMWAAIDGRLRALGLTDDLISRSDRAGCDLLDLLKLEIAPYGDSRMTVSGNSLYVPSKLAVSLGLMFHELITNAAKYGALSVPNGFLQVSWRMVGGRLGVDWDEKNGPPVRTPEKKGFGTRLLGSALASFDGQVQVDYLPAGLHCTISCKMPVD